MYYNKNNYIVAPYIIFVNILYYVIICIMYITFIYHFLCILIAVLKNGIKNKIIFFHIDCSYTFVKRSDDENLYIISFQIYKREYN